MQRRSFLSALASVVGAGAAAPATLTVSRAAAVLGVPETASVSEIAQAGVSSSVFAPGAEIEMWRLMDLLDQHRRNATAPERYLPAHIASKRSWSAAYKASVHAREQLMYDMARSKLSREHETPAGLLRRILGGSDADT